MAQGPLARIADQLYGLVPEEFTAARDTAAKAARADGDRDLAVAVKALRRPPVSAWLANLLARERGADLDDLLALGAELREAQDALDSAALRTMTHQRQAVVRALSTTARDLANAAGTTVADAAMRELEATLDAALADEAAGQALRSGRLMRPLSSSGLEAVDLSGAVAAPDDLPPVTTHRHRATARLPVPNRATRSTRQATTTKTPIKTPIKTKTPRPTATRTTPRESARAERERRLELARGALADATAGVESADAELAEARGAVEVVDAEIAELQRRLDDAATRRVQAEHTRRAADAARRAAVRVRDAAQRAVATAQARVR